MEFNVKNANEFIEKNKESINKKFFPKINYAAPIGWINDPNGVSVKDDYYHLFYQHYPYDACHGPMHWGHARTKDGLVWENLPVALAPDMAYDKNGVFSGSAIFVGDELYLMYTGHLTETDHGQVRQNQNIARSKDYINFEKYANNPVLDEKDLPANISKEDFRDPKVFKKDGKYYAVIGTKTDDKIGTVLLYESEDMLAWTYKSILISDEAYLGDMAECPDLLLFEDNKAVLLVSAMNYNYQGKKHPHKTMLIEGRMDWDNYKFLSESTREMDFGFDYYAPQSAKEDGGYFAIAWNQAWGSSLIPGEEGHKWMGQMTIPQLIFEEDDKIKRTIHPKVLAKKTLVKKEIISEGPISLENGNFIEFETKQRGLLKLSLANDKEAFDFNFDLANNKASFDRSKMAYKIKTEHDFDINKKSFDLDFKDENKFKIIVDRSSIQVYINDNYSISNTYYFDCELDRIIIEEKDLLDEIRIYDLLGENKCMEQ